MPAKAQQFVPKGMKRDYSASKADPQFSFANHNIRITAREDSTLLSITNEKGNAPIVFDPDPYNKITVTTSYDSVLDETTFTATTERPVVHDPVEVGVNYIDEFGESNHTDDLILQNGKGSTTYPGQLTVTSIHYSEDDKDRRVEGSILYIDEEKSEYPLFPGEYIGHCILNNTIILFLHKSNPSRSSFIISLEENNGVFKYRTLYVGDLGLDPKHPIETLGIYENEAIQKVYWIDGIHQPRMINIKDPYLSDNAPFDFVGSISPGIEVSITSNRDGGGNFPSGVVQYVITFLNMYGAESHPVYVSELFYTAPITRGGSPEEKSSSTFKLDITPDSDNKAPKYIRIYSILRTSLDATPTAKLVATLPIGANPVSFTDRNTTGSNVDPTELLYKGGEPIHPYTMTHKDGTLFLGNYNLEVNTIDKEIREALKEKSSVSFWSKEVDIAIPTEGAYPYLNTLDRGSRTIKTFHGRECYRFGVQLLHKTGVWSEVLYIGDARVEAPTSNPLSPVSLNIEQGKDKLKLIKAVASLPVTVINKIPEDYIGIRGVVVYPSEAAREVVCQGIICPTVYSIEGRLNNRPFAQSSWFARPIIQYRAEDDPSAYKTVDEEKVPMWDDIYRGYTKSQLDNSHLATVLVNSKTVAGVRLLPPVGGTWREFRHNRMLPLTTKNNAEIQYMSNRWTGNVTSPYVPVSTAENRGGIFFVDQSIVTLHSPEIEFSEFLHSSDMPELKLRIVGYCSVTGSWGDMTITASVGGEYRPKLFSVDSTSEKAIRSTNTTPSWFSGGAWMVYPWHRQGSLDGSEPPTGDTTWKSKLERKIISNLIFSSTTNYLQKIWRADFPYFPDGDSTEDKIAQRQKDYPGVAGVSIYKNDGNPMVKLPAPKNYVGSEELIYYGEVDKIWYPEGTAATTNPTSYNIMNLNGSDPGTSGKTGKEPVVMKYKSTPHAVIATNYTEEQSQFIMPTIYEDPDGNVISTRVEGTGPSSIKIHLMEKAPSSVEDDFPFWLRKDTEDRRVVTFTMYLGTTPPTIYTDSYVYAQNLQKMYKWETYEESWGSTGGETVTGYKQVALIPTSLYQERTLGNQYVPALNSIGEYYLIPAAGHVLGSSYGIYQDAIKLTTDHGLFWVGELYRDIEISERFGGTSEKALRENKWEVCGETQLFDYRVTWDRQVNVDGKLPLIQLATILGRDEYANKIFLLTSGLYSVIVYTKDNISPSDWVEEGPAYNTLYSVVDGSNYKWDGTKFYDVNYKVEYTEGDTYYQRYDCLKTYAYADGDENSIVDIVSFMCETRINIDGRYDRNRGNLSNLTASPNNFNLLNPVYNQSNTFFPSQYIESGRYDLFRFPNSITWSKTKLPGEEVDSWTELTLLSTMDMDGDKGEIEALRRLNNEVYCFQPLGIGRIFFNSYAQMLTQGEGTGVLPVELMNSGKVEGKSYLTNGIGASNKWSIVTTPTGMYFIDNLTNNLHLFTQEGLSDLSDKLSFRVWADEISSIDKWNPVDFSNVVAFYDSTNSDVYFVTNNPNTTLAYSELLGQFTSFYDYDNVPLMFSLNGKFYSFKNGQVWAQGAGEYNSFFGTKKPYSVEVICNMDEPLDKIFNTVEWRATVKENDKDSISTFNKIQVTTDGEYQDTGLQPITNRVNSPIGGFFKDSSPVLRRKFRMWRIPIPRDTSNGRDRIRGPWAKIKLSKEGTPTEGGPNNEKMELHDMVVHFFE